MQPVIFGGYLDNVGGEGGGGNRYFIYGPT